MKQPGKFLFISILLCSWTLCIRGQTTVAASGGDASGSGGSISYSVGQVFSNFFSGTNGTVTQGVQQPFEISVVTAVNHTEDLDLEYFVYPNPTSKSIRLTINPFDYKTRRLLLYDMNGLLIMDKEILSEETLISMDDLPVSVYFLKVVDSNNRLIKVFKILKK